MHHVQYYDTLTSRCRVLGVLWCRNNRMSPVFMVVFAAGHRCIKINGYQPVKAVAAYKMITS